MCSLSGCVLEDVALHSETLLQQAVMAAGIGLWEWHVLDNRYYFSKFLLALLHYPHETPISFEKFVGFVHPDDRAVLREIFANFCTATSPSHHDSYRCLELRVQRRDGEYIFFELNAQAIYDCDGGLQAVAGSMRDITEAKLAVEQLLLANERLEHFAYMASHDLQEPLRMVSSFTQLLERYYSEQLDERAKQFIQFASQGAKDMQALVKSLLDYARIGNGSEKEQVVDLNVMLKGALANLNVSIKEASAVIKSERLPVIRANPTQITSLLQNIVGNAIKYRQPTIAPQIGITVSTEKLFWIVSISDNGIGMKPEYCEKIFEPFKRLHRKVVYPGTGMGLAICRRVVDEIGGKIWAESEPNEGTRILFSIPIEKIYSEVGDSL